MRITDPRVLEAAQLALNGVKHEAIAAIMDVHIRTVYNWLKDPRVKNIIEESASDQFAELRTKDFFRANSLQDMLFKRLHEFINDDEKMANAKLPDLVRAHQIYSNLAREMAGPPPKKHESIDKTKVQVYIDKVLVQGDSKPPDMDKVLKEAMK